MWAMALIREATTGISATVKSNAPIYVPVLAASFAIELKSKRSNWILMSPRSEIEGVSRIEISVSAKLVSRLAAEGTETLELLVSSAAVFPLLMDEIDIITEVAVSGGDDPSLAFSPAIRFESRLVVDIICTILPPVGTSERRCLAPARLDRYNGCLQVSV
jgi:hypothetical protein